MKTKNIYELNKIYKFKTGKDWDDNILIVRNEIIKFVKSFDSVIDCEKAINEGQLSAMIYNNDISDIIFKKASIEINKLLGYSKRIYIKDLSEIKNITEK